MENPWQEFIKSLDEFSFTEYGDFKREVDYHMRRLVDTASPHVNTNQAHEIVKLRNEYLWHDHEDDEIEPMKRHLRKRIEEISLIH
ncbi:hypothetical protein [Bdellovibrio sp. HCB337]|uniref:hypothetical protein n=1 Tax=Bdellovibrio sp. HCB337 TaxID=3394358 RepID=UPI0039A6DE08